MVVTASLLKRREHAGPDGPARTMPSAPRGAWIREMSIRRTFGVAVVTAAGLASSACNLPLLHHQQQARVFIPPPPSPQPPKEPVPLLPAPPVAAMVLVSLPASLPTSVELGPPPPAPVKRPPPAPPKVQAIAPPPEPTVVIPPKLGQMFTPEQDREYKQALAESFARVDGALARLEGKHLTPEQSETADRIRTFRKQAEQTREQDLVTAVSLARRADLLAKDLLLRLP